VIEGGLEGYQHLIPWWDGENDAFDIQSVDDAALLPNLEVFDFDDRTPLRTHLGPELEKRRIKVLPALEA